MNLVICFSSPKYQNLITKKKGIEDQFKLADYLLECLKEKTNEIRTSN